MYAAFELDLQDRARRARLSWHNDPQHNVEPADRTRAYWRTHNVTHYRADGSAVVVAPDGSTVYVTSRSDADRVGAGD